MSSLLLQMTIREYESEYLTESLNANGPSKCLATDDFLNCLLSAI